MVFKQGKRGIRTGGTIRSHPQTVQRYHEHSSEPKANVTVYRPAGEDSSLNLPENFEPGVQYSLNKRNRWHLPAEVHKQMHTLAIEDHATAFHAQSEEAEHSNGKKKQNKQGRKSVVLVQHPGKDEQETPRGNYVLYYGDRYSIPVERISHKSKLDTMNVVAQLDEGSFFRGEMPVEEEGSEASKERSRRVVKAQKPLGAGNVKQLLQCSGPRGAEVETEVDSEQVHVFLADKKHVNKRQVLKQPKKVVEQQLPAAQQPFQRRISVESDEEADYDSYDEEEDIESEHQVSTRPPAATFNLSNYLVSAY